MMSVWDLSHQINILIWIIARIIWIPALNLFLYLLWSLLLVRKYRCQNLLDFFLASAGVWQRSHTNDSFLSESSVGQFIILLSQKFLVTIDFFRWNWVLTVYILKFYLVFRIDLCVWTCDNLFLRIHYWLQWTRIWLNFKLQICLSILSQFN